jgi:hypothetical protein
MPALRCLVLIVVAVTLPLASPAQDRPAGEDPESRQFRLDIASSWLRVLVYRGGLLRGLGHNHVVSHDDISGTVTIGKDPLQSQLVLEFAVAGLAVDEPEQRSLAGPDFPGQISRQDIAGTRSNMLGKKLLQAGQFPSIRIRSEHITGSLPDLEVEASVIVRRAEFTVVFPARVELSGDSFVASGELAISHAELGLNPFKAGLGTLRVRDAMVLQYQISGRRVRNPREIHFIL